MIVVDEDVRGASTDAEVDEDVEGTVVDDVDVRPSRLSSILAAAAEAEFDESVGDADCILGTVIEPITMLGSVSAAGEVRSPDAACNEVVETSVPSFPPLARMEYESGAEED